MRTFAFFGPALLGWGVFGCLNSGLGSLPGFLFLLVPLFFFRLDLLARRGPRRMQFTPAFRGGLASFFLVRSPLVSYVFVYSSAFLFGWLCLACVIDFLFYICLVDMTPVLKCLGCLYLHISIYRCAARACVCVCVSRRHVIHDVTIHGGRINQPPRHGELSWNRHPYLYPPVFIALCYVVSLHIVSSPGQSFMHQPVHSHRHSHSHSYVWRSY